MTPGAVLVARELLGDMFMELAEYDAALAEYEGVLSRAPGRFNSLHGAGLAAELLGDTGKAANHYRTLVENCGRAENSRPRLEHARRFLAER